jgi:hypothetical protein
LRHEFSKKQYFGGGWSGGETVGGLVGRLGGGSEKTVDSDEGMGAAEGLLRILYINCQALYHICSWHGVGMPVRVVEI